MKKNILLIKKITFKYVFFVLFILKNFFINSTKHVFFFRTKTVLQNSVSKHNFFFSENTKNCFRVCLEFFKNTVKRVFRVRLIVILKKKFNIFNT